MTITSEENLPTLGPVDVQPRAHITGVLMIPGNKNAIPLATSKPVWTGFSCAALPTSSRAGTRVCLPNSSRATAATATAGPSVFLLNSSTLLAASPRAGPS